MFLIKKVNDLQQYLRSNSKKGQTIGFVPTMGALHEGHLSLVHLSKEQTDLTVCSIFVNPTQFNDPNDFKTYPVTIENDIALLLQEGADVLFLPEVEEMYPNGFGQSIELLNRKIMNLLEGAFRPGHFDGMVQIVNTLLEAVNPDKLFMGQKDYQQFQIVKNLIKDRKIPVELIMGQTFREKDGLAMSSRNRLLNKQSRQDSLMLSKTLFSLKNQITKQSIKELKSEGIQLISSNPNIVLDYLEFVDSETLQVANQLPAKGNIVICIAATVGGVRLIDNVII